MKKIIVLILAGYLAGLMGAATFQFFSENDSPGTYKDPNAVHELVSGSDGLAFATYPDSRVPIENMEEMNEAFARASRESTPSVVFIKTFTEKVYTNTWYEWFFGDRPSQSYISTGSGVIFTSDGYIVTNNHVVENADVIEVIHNKRAFEASLVSTDPSTDLAVLKIDQTDLPNINIGSARRLEVGEWVLAVGNPFNLTSTVTAGIVSAKGRQINILKTNFPIESFIQTDAAINPGNSGGALVNVNGELVGINTAILSKTGSYAGYGFAVPVDIVAKIVGDLINYGEVQKAYLGAEMLDIDQQIGKEMELDDWNGVLVQKIQEGGAADKAGIWEKDIIIGIDGDEIRSKGEFEELISYHSPGDRLEIVYRRENQTRNTVVTLTNAEGTTSILKREVYTSRSLGAEFEIVPKVERELLGIPHGVRVRKIRGGLMSRLNIEEGFTITHINKIPVEDPEKLADILTKIRGRVYIEGVNREGDKGYYSYFF
ncbi:MAG: trypsin-like peptidase domain-containing protein [Cyclobacteriaceae bacterium]|nr:trypsin-like peptidase domain-containing protein [Cyclobacteriaceae bacterium]